MIMKKIIKKFLFLPLLCLIAISCAACSGNVFVGCVSNSTATKKEASYARFNGDKNYTLTVKEEVLPLVVNVHITTEEGVLSVSVHKKDNPENRPYEGNDLQTSDFTVTISESGKYVISLHADDHKGGYSFTWE